MSQIGGSVTEVSNLVGSLKSFIASVMNDLKNLPKGWNEVRELRETVEQMKYYLQQWETKLARAEAELESELARDEAALSELAGKG